MDKETLELLGLTQDQLQRKVVGTLVDKMLGTYGADEDGWEYGSDSEIAKQLQDLAAAAIEAKVNEIMGTQVGPHIETWIDSAVSAITAKRFSKDGPNSLTDLMHATAQAWMKEKVDERGRPADSYHRSGKPRVEWLVKDCVGEKMSEVIKKERDSLRAAMEQVIAEHFDAIAGDLRKELRIKKTDEEASSE